MSYDSSSTIAAIVLVYGLFLVFLVVVLIANYVLYGIALSMFFRKVGVEPWIGWVPYYRYWKWLEVGGQQGAFSLFSLIPYGAYATTVFVCIGMWHTGKAFGKDA